MAKTKLPNSAETTNQLTETVQELKDTVRTLTDAVDELRDLLEWAVNNDRLVATGRDQWRPSAMHITSMPKDPCAPGFGERLNRYAAQDLPADMDDSKREEHHQSPPANPGLARQRELWEQ